MHGDTITTLQTHFEDHKSRERTPPGDTNADIWLGDFNRHHPLWENEENDRLFKRQDLENAEPLIHLLGEHDMEQALPKGIPMI